MARSDTAPPPGGSSGCGGLSTRSRVELTDGAGGRVAVVRPTWRLENPAAA